MLSMALAPSTCQPDTTHQLAHYSLWHLQRDLRSPVSIASSAFLLLSVPTTDLHANLGLTALSGGGWWMPTDTLGRNQVLSAVWRNMPWMFMIFNSQSVMLHLTTSFLSLGYYSAEFVYICALFLYMGDLLWR